MQRLLSTVFFLLSLVCLSPALAQQRTTAFYVSNASTIGTALSEKIQANLEQFFASCRTSIESESTTPTLPKTILTKAAIASVEEMWEFSPFICPLREVQESIIRTNEGFEMRNIPVTMYDDEKGKHPQMLVIDFTRQGLIDNVSICLDIADYTRLVGDSTSIEYTRRQFIVNFIENFRTAYNKKDIAYLNQVYSDNALIITGRIIKESRPQSTDALRQSYGARIDYVKQSKAEYLTKLKASFARNKYINVTFSDINIMPHAKYDDIYGVILTQKWESSGYSDEGYLFLAIDFHDPENPLFQVRTWQPNQLPNGQPLPKEEVFGFDKITLKR